MSSYREKEVELKYLSRPTLQQLAKQHNIRANLKVTHTNTYLCSRMVLLPNQSRLSNRCCSVTETVGSEYGAGV